MRNIFEKEMPYHILTDEATGVVLTMDTRSEVMVFLGDFIKEARVFLMVNEPNYRNSSWKVFFLALENPTNYPRWTWNHSQRIFTKTKESVLNKSLFERSHLIEAQRKTIGPIVRSLSGDRMSFSKNILYQEVIYTIKKTQAVEFKNSGYDEKLITDYPFVAQYAEFADLSLRQAADDIIFQTQLYENRLLRNEFLRLKYFNAVKNMKAPQEGLVLIHNARRELYGNSLE